MVQSKCGLRDVKVIRNKKYIPQSELIAGDILLYFEGSEYTHMMLYVGNGKIADSSRGHTPQVKYGVAMRQKEVKVAIRYIGKTPKATSTKKGYTGKIPTLRLTKSNAKDRYIMHGEVSDRVADLQNFLNWYTDGKFFKECGGADGCFGDNTKKYVIQFQEKEIGKVQGDGVVGGKTIEAMAKVKK